MPTSPATVSAEAAATGVDFAGDTLIVTLDDGRELRVPLERAPWLGWLRAASPEQRTRWTLEPRGFAVYWPDLDDGVEVRHLLSLSRLS